jgi:hypothetical protein
MVGCSYQQCTKAVAVLNGGESARLRENFAVVIRLVSHRSNASLTPASACAPLNRSEIVSVKRLTFSSDVGGGLTTIARNVGLWYGASAFAHSQTAVAYFVNLASSLCGLAGIGR